jgi:hypothetical protein
LRAAARISERIVRWKTTPLSHRSPRIHARECRFQKKGPTPCGSWAFAQFNASGSAASPGDSHHGSSQRLAAASARVVDSRLRARGRSLYQGDEFQTAITASYDGTSDFNVVDRLRDCWLTLIISAQAFESLIPPQTREQADVLALNLKNLVMYRAASEVDALRCANALGKHWIERGTRTVQMDYTAHSYQRVEEFRIKPHQFRRLPDHTAIVRHCTTRTRCVRTWNAPAFFF